MFAVFRHIHKFHLNRGFQITTVRADNEFAPLQEMCNEKLPNGTQWSLATPGAHVSEIERLIRLIEERCRCMRHSFPFERVPKLLTIHTVSQAARMLTHFCRKGGISQVHSPRMLMVGRKPDAKKDLALDIGCHCEVPEDDAPRNSQKSRTQPAVCLGPVGNEQGSCKFLALNTNEKIVRDSWTFFPTPTSVIERVELIAKDQPKDWSFTDRNGLEIDAGVDEGTEAPQQLIDPAEENANPQQEPQQPKQMPDSKDLGQNETDIVPADEPTEEAEGQLLEDAPLAPTESLPALTAEPHVQASEPANITGVSKQPPESTGVRRSSGVRTQTKSCTPSFSGSKHAAAVQFLEFEEVMAKAIDQMASGEVIHLDDHMSFFQHMCTEEPDVVHFRDTFCPVHWKDLSTCRNRMTGN